MKTHYENLIRKHKSSGILVDTNLLLLLLVGNFRQDQIERFKRTSMFTVDDFELLVNLLSQFQKIITTPNILTEVSNLAGQIPGSYKEELFKVFATAIDRYFEIKISSNEVANHRQFTKFGLPDTISISLAKQHLVLTAEFPLANYLETIGLDVINFNHLRSLP